MLLAIAIAVLPVLLVSISEARRGFTLSGEQRLESPVAEAAHAYPPAREGEEKAA